MRFESRVFRLAKDTDYPERNQDSCHTDAAGGIAAIADGVASGIFSRQWAAILTEATVADAPGLDDEDSFAGWLAQRRKTWTEQIDVSNLAWHQKPKLREGACSTLLWVTIRPLDEHDRRPQDPWRIQVIAIGDSCLFHVRQGEVLRTFPIQSSDQLDDAPMVVGSVNLNRDDVLEFSSIDELCRPGDLLVLCTDAIAEWALRRQENGNPPAWEDYWSMTEQAWREEVIDLRDRREMRYDDATLLLLRVGDGIAALGQSDPSTGTSQSAETAARSAPPPLPPEGESDWAEKWKTFSEQIKGQVSDRVAWGVKKFKELKESMESKYRDKRQSDDREPPDGAE